MQPPAPERRGRPAQRQDLRVRRRIAARLALVVRDGDDLVADHDDRADRHLAPAARQLGGRQRAPHEGELPLADWAPALGDG